jgi:hypothetical protein
MIIVYNTLFFLVLFCHVEISQIKATFAILLVHHWKVLDVIRVHQGGFTMFRLMVQELLSIEQYYR